MKILSRYILRSLIGPFLFGTFTVLFLYIFQFLYNNLNDLVNKGLSYWLISQLIVLNLAWMVVFAVPMGVLFSSLMAFGNMASTHEITAMKAGGGSLIRLMFPVIITGIILTYGTYWFNDAVLPESNHRAKTLMSDIRDKKPTFTIEKGKFSSDIEGLTILARKVDTSSGKLYGVTVYDNTQSKPINIISADSGVVKFSKDQSKLFFDLFCGEIHQLIPDDVNNYRKIDFKVHNIIETTHGFAFEKTSTDKVSKSDREMPISEMKIIVDDNEKRSKEFFVKADITLKNEFDYLSGKLKTASIVPTDTNLFKNKPQLFKNLDKRLINFKANWNSQVAQAKDYQQRADSYIVEIQKKYSIPTACFLFVLVGCPLGIISRNGNFGFSAAISLVFYLFYWASLIGGEKLADRGIISPYVGMWAGNVMIGLLGVLFTFRTNNESMRLPFIDWILNFIQKKFPSEQ